MSPDASSHPTSGTPRPVGPSGPARRAAAQNRRRWILWSLVGAMILGLVGWKLVLPRVKNLRAQQFLAEAEALMRRDDYNAAVLKIMAANHLSPNNPDVLRALASFFGRLNNPRGLDYYGQLMKTPAATPADRKAYAQLALGVNRIDIAGRELLEMLKQDPKNVELLHLMVQLKMESHAFGQATQLAAAALSLQPGDEKSQFMYGSLLMRNPTNAATRGSGRRILWGLAVAEGPYSDRSAETLMADKELGRGELSLLIRDLQSRTNQRTIDSLRIYDLRMRLDPGRSNEIVTEAFTTMTATNSSPELLFLLSGWASQRGQSEIVLRQLPPERARTNALLAPIRAFALADRARWDELVPMLEDKRYPLDPVIMNVLRGRMSMANGKKAEAEAAFMTALEQPKLNPAKISLVAIQAEQVRLPLTAITAYQRLMDDPSRALSASLEILRILRRVDDVGLVRDTLKRLNEQIPGDESVAGERAWADLILQERVQESRTVGERLRQTRSHEPQWRFLLALANLRDGKAPEALALIENDVADWDRLTPRLQAVYVAVLGANQQREAARTYARKVDATHLRSAEFELVKPWLDDDDRRKTRPVNPK